MRTWMEGVRHRGVVNDDTLRNISIQKGEIFDIMAFMVHTTFTKETIVNHLEESEWCSERRMEHFMNIQLVQERISVLAERCCVDHNLKIRIVLEKEGDTTARGAE